MRLHWRPRTRASRVERVLGEPVERALAFPGLRAYRDRLLQRPGARRLFSGAPPC